MDALEQFLGGGQASSTKWTGASLSTQKIKQLQDAADAGDAAASALDRSRLAFLESASTQHQQTEKTLRWQGR